MQMYVIFPLAWHKHAVFTYIICITSEFANQFANICYCVIGCNVLCFSGHLFLTFAFKFSDGVLVQGVETYQLTPCANYD